MMGSVYHDSRGTGDFRTIFSYRERREPVELVIDSGQERPAEFVAAMSSARILAVSAMGPATSRSGPSLNWCPRVKRMGWADTAGPGVGPGS